MSNKDTLYSGYRPDQRAGVNRGAELYLQTALDRTSDGSSPVSCRFPVEQTQIADDAGAVQSLAGSQTVCWKRPTPLARRWCHETRLS